MKTCPICFAKAGDDASTCFECLYSFAHSSARGGNAAWSDAVDDVTLAVATPPASGVHLTVANARGRAGSAHRQRVRSARGSIYVGSGPFNDVVVAGADVARRAVHLYRDGGAVWAESLDAHPGFSLNGNELVGATELCAGDVLSIGPVSITIDGG